MLKKGSSMDTLDTSMDKRSKTRPDITSEILRSQIREHSKNFKTSWVNLGQALYSVWKDKLFYAWGYDKFEYYVEQEVGLPKQLSLKLLKSYFFLEQEEPEYLKRDFNEKRDASKVPGYEAVNVLRLAKQRKELFKEDYLKLKRDVFDKGRGASSVRHDLTALLKERKPIDPEEERDTRNVAAIRKLFNALNSFDKDMEALKLIPDEIVKEAKELMTKVEKLL
jgi:hypothetical protein